MNGYSSQKIEKKGQEYGDKKKTFYTDLDDEKAKKYVLAMFPYPSSSAMHIGHVRNYTIADIFARYYRLKGFNVLSPMGGDAFGLPAEENARKTNNHPSSFTQENIEKFKKQLKELGFAYDGSKEINTSDPKYYQLTQGVFCQIYKKGLAEYKQIPVQGCEVLGTALSNEEIKIVGDEKVSERGGYPVTKRNLFQGSLKITNYAEQLLESLDSLDGPQNIKTLQKNGIGLSRGNTINFFFSDNSFSIPVFTTRPDTIYGARALAVSSNHSLLKKIVKPEKEKDVSDFCKYGQNKENREQEITAVFTGSYVVNPLNTEKIPVGVANFVVEDFGTGVVMISPFFNKTQGQNTFVNQDTFFSSKERQQNYQVDFAFVDKYNLNEGKKAVFESVNGTKLNYTSSNLSDKSRDEAIKKVNCELRNKKIGQISQAYHLRDGVFSRQRYGGEPIPVIHGENGKRELLDEKELPLVLPPLVNFAPDPRYYAPLLRAKQGVDVEKEGLRGKRDVNVMPQGAASCIYELAYLLKTKDGYLPWDSELAKKRINKGMKNGVDMYVGGAEHANLHLLYSRFWYKVLYEKGIVPGTEPFKKLFCQGVILGPDGEKMSKSRGNVINSSELVQKYGADALRIHLVFMAPSTQTIQFDERGIKSMKKWLNRVYRLFTEKKVVAETDHELKTAHYNMVHCVNNYLEQIKPNLIVSSLMVFINQCYKSQDIPLIYAQSFCQILSIIAPHTAEEIGNLWHSDTVANSSGPIVTKTTTNTTNIVVQINGKKRAVISLELDLSQKKVEQIVNKQLKKLFEKKKIDRIIFVKNKLINFVAKKQEKNSS